MTETVYVKTYVLETVEDIREMRADDEFTDGAFALLSYPTAPPQVWINFDNPKYWGGQAAHLGDTVAKDAAGNFYVNGVTK